MKTVAVALAAVVLAVGGTVVMQLSEGRAAAAFEDQVCALPPEWLELTRRGYFKGRSGQIALLPRTPMYMTTGSKGWTHSGPWDYLQEIPLVFYGPGLIPEWGHVGRSEVTLADVAPTVAELLEIDLPETDGVVLPEVAGGRGHPRVVVTVVWDGGGRNGLEQWPNAWPNLRQMMDDGVAYDARVGSSPSVTPAVHTTLGTGVFPDTHGITDVPMRDETGTVVDPFLDGQTGRYIEIPTLAERWDDATGGRAEIGMVGYEPWHLGMIGRGAETEGADRDHAVWVNRGSNHWVTKRDHYALPASFRDQSDLAARLDELDAGDGTDDDRWMRVPLDDATRIEETPAFIAHHAAKLNEMLDAEGYGADRITDLLFTNFKQIDRLAHYFNMTAPEVEAMIKASDDALGELVDHLERTVGHGRYVVIVTADHGMQPDTDDIGAYAIDPNEIERDIAVRFGPVVRSVWPTQAFLLDDVMAEVGVSDDDVARFLSDYRLRDNATTPALEAAGKGSSRPEDLLFELAVPSDTLASATC